MPDIENSRKTAATEKGAEWDQKTREGWAHSEGHPHAEGTFTGTLVNVGNIRRNSGECQGGMALRVRQSSPDFARVRMKARVCFRYTLEPASEKATVAVRNSLLEKFSGKFRRCWQILHRFSGSTKCYLGAGKGT